MPTKKLVVSTYGQYISIAVSALLLFAFVPRLGALLAFFVIGGLAYDPNLPTRRLEEPGMPGAVPGGFLGLKAPIREDRPEGKDGR